MSLNQSTNPIQTIEKEQQKSQLQPQVLNETRFIENLKQSLLNVKFHINQDKFLQQSKELFSKQFLKKVNTVFQPSHQQKQSSEISLSYRLLQMNQLCLYNLANQLAEMEADQEKAIQTSRKNKHYEVLQEAVQKAQNQIRKHIGIEHQMKICLEQLEDQLNDLLKDNQQYKKQNYFLKKEISSLKKKQISDSNTIFQFQQKLRVYNQIQLKNGKHKSKLYSEPQSSILHDTSRKSLKKSVQIYSLNKRVLNSKSNGCSKLGSRKISKLMLQNGIDVNSHNFITINNLVQKQQIIPVTKTEGKQIFWNRRLKKRQAVTINNGTYADYGTYKSMNRSHNISPRQLRKQQKQRQIKQIYSNNTKQVKKAKQLIMSKESSIITQKKQKRRYQNVDACQLRKSLNVNYRSKDRSKSVVY